MDFIKYSILSQYCENLRISSSLEVEKHNIINKISMLVSIEGYELDAFYLNELKAIHRLVLSGRNLKEILRYREYLGTYEELCLMGFI